jgi:hypothetical protein
MSDIFTTPKEGAGGSGGHSRTHDHLTQGCVMAQRKVILLHKNKAGSLAILMLSVMSADQEYALFALRSVPVPGFLSFLWLEKKLWCHLQAA